VPLGGIGLLMGARWMRDRVVDRGDMYSTVQ
jgi:hypothetical protein